MTVLCGSLRKPVLNRRSWQNIIAELINHELGYKTTLVNNLGSGTVVHQAMIRNDADISATVTLGPTLPVP